MLHSFLLEEPVNQHVLTYILKNFFQVPQFRPKKCCKRTMAPQIGTLKPEKKNSRTKIVRNHKQKKVLKSVQCCTDFLLWQCCAVPTLLYYLQTKTPGPSENYGRFEEHAENFIQAPSQIQ